MWQFILLSLMVLLSSCQTATKIPENTTKPNPKWLLTPPNDSNIYLYGIGDGINRKAAIHSALADIASKISINVSAEFNSKLSVNNREYELIKTDSDKIINAKSISININNYQVDDIFVPLPTKIYVLVKTNRRRLLNSYISLLDNTLNEFQLKRKDLLKSNKFTQYKFFKQSELNLTNFTQNRLIVNSLNSQIDIKKYIIYEQTVKAKLQKLTASFKFNTVATDKNSKDFVTALNMLLAKQQLLATKKSQFKITVTTTKNIARSHGLIIQNYLVSMIVFEKNEVINNQQINIKYVGSEQTSTTPYKVIKKFIKKLPPILNW